MYEQQPCRQLRIRVTLSAILVFTFIAGTIWAIPGRGAGIFVKYVLGNSVYLQAGRDAGLREGQRLTVGRNFEGQAPAVVGEIEIETVASTSSAGRIVSSKKEIVPGDLAYLSQEDLKQDRTQAAPSAAPKSQPIGAARSSTQKPYGAPQSKANRIRGRLGADFNALQIPGEGIRSSQFGFTLRLDATRLAGSYWSIQGHYRGRVQSRKNPLQQETLTDLINRTYHLNITYNGPESAWAAGAGRLYIPWASSLSTLDGFYVGRRIGRQTVGIFGGTTPDPSSWNYDPDRQMAGAFVNTERGSFESFRFSSTAGVALSRLDWKPERQFGFFENGLFYRQYVSVYSNLEVDLRTASQTNRDPEVLLTRSYTTVRLQPHKSISFDINENYFKNLPTFDPRLIGTGLVDQFLFQGLSGGFRLHLPHHVAIFGNTGRSSRTGDLRSAWNYLGGASWADIFHSGVRAEYRFSRFDSSFGHGTYQSAGFSREVEPGLRFDARLGQQDLTSTFTTRSRARFVNGNVDWYLGMRYFLGCGLTVYRGQGQNYNQYFLTFGYRFSNRR